MSKKVPSISEAEWQVMNVLWEKPPHTANEVYFALEGRTDWKLKTVRSLLDRLVQKKVVGVNKNQKVYTFYPLYSQDEYQRAETQSFIKRIYGGTLKSMLVQFIQEESLSEEDIKELRSILDGKTKKPQERNSKSNGVVTVSDRSIHYPLMNN